MAKTNKKILVIGDLHLREKLGYADYIKNGRKKEGEQVLDHIIKESSDCDTVILLGDNFNARNNTSEVIKRFVAFLERFNDKDIYILSGNHEKNADGKTAIDFLREVNKPNWTIITNEILIKNTEGMTFLPYMTKPELEAKDDAAGTKKLMTMLTSGKMLFLHHAISDSMAGVVSTNIFNEIVLPKTGLEKKYQLIFGGHIHTPQVLKGDRTYIAGSIFNNEIGDTQKYVWKIDKTKLTVSQHKLPGRGIYKLENPSVADINKIAKKEIIKVVINDKKIKKDVAVIKKALEKFDAYLLLEQYPNERKKVHFEEGMLELDVEKLLDIYAKEKKIDRKALKVGWDLIK